MEAEAAEAILAGIDGLVTDLRREMNSRFDKVDVEQAHLKDQVKGLKADLSDNPSRKQFEELKARVDRYHPG